MSEEQSYQIQLPPGPLRPYKQVDAERRENEARAKARAKGQFDEVTPIPQPPGPLKPYKKVDEGLWEEEARAENRAKRITPVRYNDAGEELCIGVIAKSADPSASPTLCNNPAVDNTDRCDAHQLLHGKMGLVRSIVKATPETKTDRLRRSRVKTQERLAALVDPSIAVLAREMRDADKSSDRQAAANSLLDRAGWGRVQKVEHSDARAMLLQRLLEFRGEAIGSVGPVEGLEGVGVPFPEIETYNEDGEIVESSGPDVLGGEHTLEYGIDSEETPEQAIQRVIDDIESEITARSPFNASLMNDQADDSEQ